MERILEFNLNQKVYELICHRVKLKSHLIKILIELSSLILANLTVKETELGKCIIKVGNSQRIFFTIQDAEHQISKHFSFNFPFQIYEENGRFTLETLTGGVRIESHHIAILRAISAEGAFDEKECRHGVLLDFAQLVESAVIDLGLVMAYCENDLNQILIDLFTFEPSYIRYDYDIEHENGASHPLHHLDIFYTQSTTFKLGCEQLELDKFMEVLDQETECKFLQEYPQKARRHSF